MKVGFDMDGVLANFDQGYREVLEQVVHKLLPDTPAKQWEWPAALGITDAQEQEAWDRINKMPDFWSNLPNAPEFTDTIRKMLRDIAKKHDVYFITDRPTRGAKRQTEEWLLKRELPPSVLITPAKGLAARVLNLDAYVDDRPQNLSLVKFDSPTTRMYLQHRPWNAMIAHVHSERITGLAEMFDKEAL